MSENALDVWNRFEELVPWYVNGTITRADRRWVDEFILSHRAAATFLQWETSLAKRLNDAIPSFMPETGFDRLQARMRAEPAAENISLSARLRTLWSGLIQQPTFALATLAVVMLQAGVIGSLLNAPREAAPEYALTRSLTPAPNNPALLRVSFKSEVTEANLRGLLMEIGGAIVGGPGQLGAYLVQVPPARLDQAVATLKASPWIMAAEAVPPTPAQP